MIVKRKFFFVAKRSYLNIENSKLLTAVPICVIFMLNSDAIREIIVVLYSKSCIKFDLATSRILNISIRYIKLIRLKSKNVMRGYETVGKSPVRSAGKSKRFVYY